MYQNQKWKDDADQPGLFTFYLEQQARELNSRKPPEIRLSHLSQGAETKKQSNLRRATQRYTMDYSDWNNYKCRSKEEKLHQHRSLLLDPSKNPEYLNKHQKYATRDTSNKVSIQTRQKKRNSNSEMQLKKRNLNECFAFDINKSKSKMFIFRGEPVRLTKRNYKQTEVNVSARKKIEQSKNQIQRSLIQLKNQQRAMNSELDRHPKYPTIKMRYNFVQFLNERRKKQNLDKTKQTSLNRMDNNNGLKLQRLLSVNKPQGMCLRSKTER